MDGRHSIVVVVGDVWLHGLYLRMTGVSLLSGNQGQEKPWQAQVIVSRNPLFIGWYETAQEAARNYDRVARSIFGSATRLNFPEEVREREQ